ncbi:DUF3080 domain-containing protein [Photobacterium sagamiensis]|uniref:DUF3080 domain-containing protein n=1 Tax=Photobacterium sagamiensis TaxID=2910241 RepID=UPI003D0FA3D7
MLLAISLLVGCERNSTENSLHTYHNRLANVLDVVPAAAPDTKLAPLPDIRELQLPIEDIRIGLLDAYELRKCELFHLIAERNSVLGKVQDKTHQLRYELLLVNGLSRCISMQEEDSELQAELKQLHQKKQQQLPRYFWNMLVTGDEWRKQFTLLSVPFSLGQFPGFVENQEAMRHLAGLVGSISQQQPIPAKSAEALLFHQQQIHIFRYFGQLFYSLARTRDWLITTTEMLEAHEQLIICGPNRNQQKAEYLSNVFYRFFVSDIQPYLSELDSQYRQLQPDLQKVFTIIPSGMTSFIPYQKQHIDGAIYQSFRQATLSHVKFWQRTFDRCKIKVGL